MVMVVVVSMIAVSWPVLGFVVMVRVVLVAMMRVPFGCHGVSLAGFDALCTDSEDNSHCQEAALPVSHCSNLQAHSTVGGGVFVNCRSLIICGLSSR